jgi:hypothetical protein
VFSGNSVTFPLPKPPIPIEGLRIFWAIGLAQKLSDNETLCIHLAEKGLKDREIAPLVRKSRVAVKQSRYRGRLKIELLRQRTVATT